MSKLISRTKICGLNDFDNLKEVLALKPAMVGHVYFEKSPRHCEIGTLQEMSDLDYAGAKKVLVVVDLPLEELFFILSLVEFDFIQLHGSESQEYIDTILAEFEIGIIKVIKLKNDFDFSLDYSSVNYYLFDYQGRASGGNGKSFDWQKLSTTKIDSPFILSGGINPDNLAAAEAFIDSSVNCQFLDVNSGFETTPGQKDIRLIEKYLC